MPNNTYLDKYIKDGKAATISLKNIYESMLISSESNPNHVYRTAFNDFFIKHADHIKDCIQLYQIPDTMYYKPKLVSMSLYGTTELWIALLRLNRMTHITEFHYPIIKVYNPDRLSEYINIFFKREGAK